MSPAVANGKFEKPDHGLRQPDSSPEGKVTAYFKFKSDQHPKGWVRRLRTFQTADERDVEERRLFLRGELLGSPEPRTFAELVDDYMSAYHQNQKIRGPLKSYIMPRFGDLLLADITTDDVEDLRYEVGLDKGRRTTEAIMRDLGDLFNHAVNNGWLRDADNPVTAVTDPLPEDSRRIVARRKRQRRLYLPSMSDLARIVATTTGVLLTIFLLAIFCGLRGQEIRALRNRHITVDRVKKQVVINVCRAIKKASRIEADLKTNSGLRFVYAGGLVYDYFEKLLGDNPDPDALVAPGPDGGIYDANTLWSDVHECQVAAGIGIKIGYTSFLGSFGLHMFRHAAAALWIWSSMEDDEIRRQLGHSIGNLHVSLEVYGYLFEAQLNNPHEWPSEDPPMAVGDDEDIIRELEDV